MWLRNLVKNMTQENRVTSQRRSRRSRTKEGSTSSKRQVNYHALYNPFPPTEVFSTDQVAAMHNTSLKILEYLDMKVLLPEAIKNYRMAGAKVVDDIVYIGRDLVAVALDSAPKSIQGRAGV